MRRATQLLLFLPLAAIFWRLESFLASQAPRQLRVARAETEIAAAPEPAAAAPIAVPAASPADTTPVEGLSLDLGAGLGVVRLHVRPEWSAESSLYALSVARAGSNASTIYRLEPGFLIQGRLLGSGIKAPRTTPKAPKVMERGEVGWAGGGAGPDFFIYLGSGPATWLGNPHDGTIWAEVADEESMAAAERASLLPVPMHGIA